MAITGAVAAAVRKFDPFPEFSEVRAFRGRRETGGRQFYKSGGLIVPRYEMLPGVLVQGGTGFGQREVNGAWRGARDGEPLIGDGGLRGAEARPNLIRNPVGAGAVVGVIGSGGQFPTNWGSAQTPPGMGWEIVATGEEAGLPYVDIRVFGTPTNNARPLLRFEVTNSFSSGVTFTLEAYLKRLAGIVGLVNFYGPNLTGAVSFPITDNFARYAKEVGSTGTTGLFWVDFASVVNGVPYDATVRVAAPNWKQGPDINDPPILQTSGLAATRTAMAYSESGRSIAPVHYGVVRAQLVASLANHEAGFPIIVDFRALSGPARVTWYGLKSDGTQRFQATADDGTVVTINPGINPVVGQYQTFAWACRAGALAISRNGGAVQVTGVPSIASAFSRVGWAGSAISPGQSLCNAEIDLGLIGNGEISNDNLQALAARFAA